MFFDYHPSIPSAFPNIYTTTPYQVLQLFLQLQLIIWNSNPFFGTPPPSPVLQLPSLILQHYSLVLQLFIKHFNSFCYSNPISGVTSGSLTLLRWGDSVVECRIWPRCNNAWPMAGWRACLEGVTMTLRRKDLARRSVKKIKAHTFEKFS